MPAKRPMPSEPQSSRNVQATTVTVASDSILINDSASVDNDSAATACPPVHCATDVPPASPDARSRSLPGSPDVNAISSHSDFPSSPGRNRQLFLASVSPQHMTCDLTAAIVGLGVKHNLVAIVIASFPIQNGPPARRHIFLMDSHGVTGLTVWNADVHKFSKNVLGGVVTVTRASVSIYQGKKNLVLSKDSSVVVDTVTQCPMSEWWERLSARSPLPLPAAVIAADNTVINVFGVLAFVSNETKEVNGLVRCVTSVHLASQTARFQLRGWDLEQTTLDGIEQLRDRVVQVRRVRVTCFAEQKIGEILDSTLGTLFSPYHDAALESHWAE